MDVNNDTLSRRIARITRLVGSDPGFYLIALHSFIERYIKDIYPRLGHIDPEEIGKAWLVRSAIRRAATRARRASFS